MVESTTLRSIPVGPVVGNTKVGRLWTPVQNKKTPSVIGERLGIQADIKHYKKLLFISCLTKTSPNPTTRVADWACAWIWSQHKKQKLWTLDVILLRAKSVSMLLTLPFCNENMPQMLPIWVIVFLLHRNKIHSLMHDFPPSASDQGEHDEEER